MNCGRFERLIDSYLDGQISGSLLAEFHAHRLNCRRCTRIVSMLQAAGDVLAQDHCEPKISRDFADRVLAAMPTAQKANRSLWLVRLTASAAGLAAAAAITMAVLMGEQAPKTNLAGAQAIWEGSNIEVPGDAERHHMAVLLPQSVADAAKDGDTSHNGTLLDGKVVRDAMNQMIWWDEVKLKGQ